MNAIKRIIRYAWVAPLILVSACTAEDLTIPADGDTTDELRLTLNVPEYIVTEIGTRAESAAEFADLTVYCYDKSGKYLDSYKLTSGWTAKGSGKYDVTVPLHRQTAEIQLATGVTATVNDGKLADTYHSDPAARILWGKAKLADVLSKPASERSITLLRHNAKVSVSSSTADLTINRFGVYGTATQGSVAPAELTSNPTKPTNKSGEPFGLNEAKPEEALKSAQSEISIFETPKDELTDATNEVYSTRSRIVLEATYRGVKGYYPVAFRTMSGSGDADKAGAYRYTALDIIRGHHYKVTVEGANGYGYATLTEAMKAEPDNRLRVLLSDTNEQIVDITATEDYELGVCDRVEAGSTATSIRIAVVSSYPAPSGVQRITLTDDATWIKTEGLTLPAPTEVSTQAAHNAKGYLYNIDVPLEANTTGALRNGTITVRSGELMRTITVSQMTFDFMRDNARKVTMLMDGTTVTSDYFRWVDQTLRGATADDFYQEGVHRNDGLNFPAVPAYTATYRIAKLQGDTDAKISGADFKLNTSSSAYYEITITPTTPGISTGTFSVKNASGITITYPLYRCGYLHELKDSSRAHQYQPRVQTGWRYYEVVKAGNIWTLDRNIGATDNYPYISTWARMQGHKDASGAYFRLTASRQTNLDNPTTVISDLGMSKWSVPTVDDLTALGINVTDLTPTGAERTYIGTIATQSPSKLATVYLAHGGYYEDESLQFETHANLWTRTLLTGNQGYSSTSPEFGYWFKYLDVYTTICSYGNLRIANGTAGEAPTSESIFKYMPVRPVWK